MTEITQGKCGDCRWFIRRTTHRFGTPICSAGIGTFSCAECGATCRGDGSNVPCGVGICHWSPTLPKRSEGDWCHWWEKTAKEDVQ